MLNIELEFAFSINSTKYILIRFKNVIIIVEMFCNYLIYSKKI